MKIRKQVYELSLSDFKHSPVWEFALDEEDEEGQGEATVRPFEFTPPLNPSEGMFVVQAGFLFADGMEMKGYLTPSPERKIGYIQPIIIADNNQVGFWHGIQKPSKEDISAYYKSFNKSFTEVFPITYKSVVELTDGIIEGVIDGFMYYSKDMKVTSIK